MDAATLGLLLIIVVALAFDYTNGFHDSANAIATSVSTRALTPRAALLLAAVLNVVGALVSTKVADDRRRRDHRPPRPAATGWWSCSRRCSARSRGTCVTWYFGLPSSSSHALIGGLVGAALAASQTVQWHGVVDKVVMPMVLSPLVGFGLALPGDGRGAVGVPAGATRAGPTAASGTRRSARPRDGLRPRHCRTRRRRWA